jgi:cysteine desulfurase/selenocysteine lyase
MSTSDPSLPLTTPDAGNWAAGFSGSNAFAPGLPSPAELSRLANALFNALPEESQPPVVTAANTVLPSNSAQTGNPYAAAPGPTAPAVPGQVGILVDEERAHRPFGFVDTPDRNIAPDLRSATAAPESPARPAVPGVIPHPPSVPSFGFLQDARPIFVQPEKEPLEARAVSTASAPSPVMETALPSDASYAAIPASLLPDLQLAQSPQPPAPAIPSAFGVVDSVVPSFSFIEEARPIFSAQPTIPGPVPAVVAQLSPFAAPLDRNAPQLPGTVAHGPDHKAPSTFDPDKQSRSLESFNGVPVVAPAEVDEDSVGDLGLSSSSFDVEAIRRDFPILREVVSGHPLIWLDNGATTQKPQSVIDRISYFYEHENSNVHRAAHELAARSTDAYEAAREKARRFLNAGSTREIVFVRGATEAINLVAQSWGRRNIQKDDEIVVSWMEHHANIVPWQMLCSEKGARLRVIPVDDSGQVLLDEYEKLLGPKTKLVSITHVSNALGTILPVQEMVEAAHRHGARVLVDGAQAVSHMRVDVQSINCDFYVFSGHKVFAPTGIGVVYGKSEVLDNMPPWQGGGNMIQDVTFEKTLYQPPPQRFEAGTGNIADAVGLGAAIDYLDRVGIANVSRHEHMLLTYATTALLKIPALRIIGTAKEKAGVLSFVIDGFRTEEIGDYLNRKGIAVRGGHHCAQPILRRFGLESTVRATLALYNTCEEIDALVAALWDLRQGRGIGLA